MSTLGDAADVKFGNFGKFQETERFLIPCPRHVSSRLPPSGKTCKYATAPSTQKNKFGEILYLLMCSFLLFLSWLLRSWVRKFRRDLWITLYNWTHFYMSLILDSILFYVTRNLMHSLIMNLEGKNLDKLDIYIYIYIQGYSKWPLGF